MSTLIQAFAWIFLDIWKGVDLFVKRFIENPLFSFRSEGFWRAFYTFSRELHVFAR